MNGNRIGATGWVIVFAFAAGVVHASAPATAPAHGTAKHAAVAKTAPAAAAPADAVTGAAFKSVTLHIFNRVFAAFHDKVVARRGVEFRVGDSDYTARVVEYVPDFTMNLKTHQVTTRSPEPHNPAFRVIVRRGGTPQDTAWVFLNMPPHFARKSMLAFIATKIEFDDRPTIASSDSLALQIMQREREGH